MPDERGRARGRERGAWAGAGSLGAGDERARAAHKGRDGSNPTRKQDAGAGERDAGDSAPVAGSAHYDLSQPTRESRLPEAAPLPDLSRPSCGTFSPQLCRAVLEQVAEAGAILSLSVSSGHEERVFFFTRGAILFMASGPSGRRLLEVRAIARGVLPEARILELAEKARADGTPLQDVLIKTGGVPKEDVARLIEEILEENLVQIALWDGALYDLTTGSPPQKLYDRDAPALRLSTGVKGLLDRVRPRIDRAATALTVLGSLKNLVLPSKIPPRGSADLEPEAMALRAIVADEKKRIRDVVALARQISLDPLDAVHHLAELVTARRLAVEVDVVALTREQELAAALEIERAMDAFVNKLLADMHLARIYTKLDDKENAALHYRAIATEHLAHDRREEGLGALREVVKQEPKDLEARELIVKVLQSANRVSEAAKEAVELGRVFIQYGLPGRARQAFELSLALVPGSTNVLWMLGGLLNRLGYKDDAVRVFEDLTVRAKEQGDQAAVIASSQQILTIVPAHATATSVLKTIPGYARASTLRWALVAASLAILGASIGWGTFEMLALSAFRRAGETVEARVREHHFDEARAAAHDFESSWHLSRHAASAALLLERVDEEERAVLDHASAREARLARAFEQKGQLPQAREHWQLAQGSSDPALAKEVDEGFARCTLRVETANQDLSEARHALEHSFPEQAHDAIVRALERAPWLRTPAIKVPVRVETVPKGAQVTLDGQPLADPTPLVLEHVYGPGVLRLEARARDPVTLTLDALPPWPLRVVLPRHPVWCFSEIDLTCSPLALGATVVGVGRDRSIAAFGAADGKLRWRAELGLFGECDLPLARSDDRVVARLDLGTVIALDQATGHEVWRQETTPLPPDAPDPLVARPIAAPGGHPGPRGRARPRVPRGQDGRAPLGRQAPRRPRGRSRRRGRPRLRRARERRAPRAAVRRRAAADRRPAGARSRRSRRSLRRRGRDPGRARLGRLPRRLARARAGDADLGRALDAARERRRTSLGRLEPRRGALVRARDQQAPALPGRRGTYRALDPARRRQADPGRERRRVPGARRSRR